MTYDSIPDTLNHIRRVQTLLAEMQSNLARRAIVHDTSKLESPEKETFDRVTPQLKGSTYGSDEYKRFLAEMKPALDHHYAANSHHPEHFGYLECNICFAKMPLDHNSQCPDCGNGMFTTRPDIGGMSLLDLVEMLCDWKAAGERHADGSISRSLEINQKRFEITPQLAGILKNTAKELEWL